MRSAPVANPAEFIEYRRADFLISTDPARLDLDVIYTFLTNCYWAKGIPRELVARSIGQSLCFGIYENAREEVSDRGELAKPKASQVGFARIVSDFATVAYLGDVFVLESHRGRGLGKWMMECITQHPALQGLRRWILLTRDAHEFYAKVGFTPLIVPDRYMELHRPDVYQDTVAKGDDL
jgi:GNAT superfamily N-acetyltransferase